jgi:xanthine dehydrogenase accessory factor
MAIDAARAMLARGASAEMLDIPLGPEIGQCCGGRTLLTVERMDAETAARVRARAATEHAALPAVYVLGAGHVGRALAAALALLPVRPIVVDSRADELAMVPAGIEIRQTPLPEAVVRDAAPGSAFAILTHDHALDFLIAREALARGDAAYVGMIGSKTKLASFRRWLREIEEPAPDIAPLVCPIGAAGRPDKRPAVIAAFVAAEIMQKLTTWQACSPAVQQGK